MDTFATIRCPVASGCFALAARVARSETDVSSCANGDRQTDRRTDVRHHRLNPAFPGRWTRLDETTSTRPAQSCAIELATTQALQLFLYEPVNVRDD